MSIKKILAKLNNRQTRLLPKFSTFTWSLIIAFLVLSASFIKNSLNAQSDIITQYSQTIKEGNPNLENWNSSNTDNTILKTLDTVVGVENVVAIIKDPNAKFVAGGAIGTTNNLIAALYTPPASGVQYLAQIRDNFLGKPIYAQGQGLGFNGLQPILPIWRGFRNIVYILSSIVFVIMGLLIMFRVKTGPQTIVTIQNAIPKIITTLILVTFSYAIAGLLIDLINLLQMVFLSALFAANGTPLTDNLFPTNIGRFTEWLSKAIGVDISIDPTLYNFAQLSSADRWQTMKLLNLALPQTLIILLSVLIGGVVGAIVAGALTLGSGGLFGFAIGAVLILVIVQIVILIKLIQFVFGLAKVYLSIILKIILAPLEIGLGSFPGIKIGFGSWITGLVANLSVFPISYLFLVILNVITSQIQKGGDLWTPPMLSGVTGITRAVLGFAGILLIAKLPELIPQVIYQIKPSPWGTAIGESNKSITSLFMGGLNMPGQIQDYRAKVSRAKFERAKVEKLNREGIKSTAEEGVTQTGGDALTEGNATPRKTL